MAKVLKQVGSFEIQFISYVLQLDILQALKSYLEIAVVIYINISTTIKVYSFI